jgi:hypothetical protein
VTQPVPQDNRQAELVAAGAVATLMTVAQFTAMRRMLSFRLSSVLSSMFRGLGSWRDHDSDRFVAQAVPLVQGAQRALASVTSTYIAAQASRFTGDSSAAHGSSGVVAPPSIPDSETVNLRGVDPAAVYHRPFIATRVALAKGDDLVTVVATARWRQFSVLIRASVPSAGPQLSRRSRR